ncbi:MAG: vanadium-dependent haloperoxidase [Actinomycetota bacterium]|nr:vanadium-dependent haloperoxidase [Actinomycetota bacterium]
MPMTIDPGDAHADLAGLAGLAPDQRASRHRQRAGGARQPRRHSPRPLVRSATGAGLAVMLGAALLVATTGASSASVDETPNAVLAWNANAGDAAIAACIAPLDNPLHESHLYAMAQIAVHDALNAIDLRSRPYAFVGRALPGASPEAAVAAAARGVLVPVLEQLTEPFGPECIDAGVAVVEADYTAAIGAIPAGRARSRGIRVGENAAAAILALRADDGSDTPLLDFDYPQGTEPGEYRFTPGQTFAFAPGWGEVTPFVLTDSSQYRPGLPYPVDSTRYAADFVEVKNLGGDDLTTPSARTEEQTEIACFWLVSSPLMWNQIARTVAGSEHLDLWDSSRLLGLLNMALADGYVGSFDTKYDDNFWRPVTAIQTARTDGNPLTVADPTWTPLVPTPPIPDHDAAHAVEGGAGAAVLAGFFGTNRIPFAANSIALPEGVCNDPEPVVRHFTSFSQAAAENAASRIYIGFHFRHAAEAGTNHGGKIGIAAVLRYMQPLPTR